MPYAPSAGNFVTLKFAATLAKMPEEKSPGADAQAALRIGSNGLKTALAANAAAAAAMEARRDERGERDAEKSAGSTPELRKTVGGLIVRAGNRVNSVADLDPENEDAATAIKKVRGIINDYKAVASEFKGNKKEDPAPEPEPESTTIS